MTGLDCALSRQGLAGGRTCVESDGRLLHRAQDACSYESTRSIEGDIHWKYSRSEYFQISTKVSGNYRGKRRWWLPDLGSNQGPAD